MFHIEKMENTRYPFAANLANSMNWNMTPEDFEFNSKIEPNGCLMLLKEKEPIGIVTSINYGKVG
ncbi:MAG: hypothetical protein GX638_13345, partial [Crenarchaeota archaeon]|nr:hypothetical protein [Thermoproteota archaeon]